MVMKNRQKCCPNFVNKEYDVERFFRDAKILEIGEGTSEIQRVIISKAILN